MHCHLILLAFGSRDPASVRVSFGVHLGKWENFVNFPPFLFNAVRPLGRPEAKQTFFGVLTGSEALELVLMASEARTSIMAHKVDGKKEEAMETDKLTPHVSKIDSDSDGEFHG